MKVTEITGENKQIGLLTRTGATGPEKKLVNSFIKYIPQCFHWQKGAVAIFHEPRLETGFPDLVIVQYLPEVFDNWAAARSTLITRDLKILHYLWTIQGADVSTLTTILGVPTKTCLASINRLFDAGLITCTKTKWKVANRIFGLRSIIAVEAKIKNWSDAFHQSQLNLWFASEVYILLPIENPSPIIVNRSQDSGIGIFLLNGNHVRRVQGTRKNDIPSSYGSWMFNELIGRYLHQ